MEGEPTEQDIYDKTFIEEPAILDKHKAAAVIVDGKLRLFQRGLMPAIIQIFASCV
jgi:hypothetical protein